MSKKTPLSQRKAKRQIKPDKNNKIEAVPSPKTKTPVKRKTKFYLFIVVMLVLNGFTYAYWLTDIFDDTLHTPNIQAKNLPQPNKKRRNVELPPDWDLPPQNTPVDMGYNASSGQLPPGALPPGVNLPGISGMNSTMAGRTMAQGYGATDNIRQNFTGQIRDSESSLLYYGARYYNPQHGRFTSVDPENASAELEDPQSWNAYAYARNNPLKYVDPDGREYKICDMQGNCWTHNDDQLLKAKKAGGFDFVGSRNAKTGLDSGTIYDSEGNEIGTYQQTSHDSRIQQMLWGAKPTLDIWQPVIEAIQPTPVPGGAVVGSIVKVGKGAKLTKTVWKATKASRPLKKMGHAQKHLKDFQKIDPSLTEDDVAKILQTVKNNGTPTPSSFGSTNYEAIVEIGGKSVTVKVNVSSGGIIKTGFPIN